MSLIRCIAGVSPLATGSLRWSDVMSHSDLELMGYLINTEYSVHGDTVEQVALRPFRNNDFGFRFGFRLRPLA